MASGKPKKGGLAVGVVADARGGRDRDNPPSTISMYGRPVSVIPFAPAGPSEVGVIESRTVVRVAHDSLAGDSQPLNEG
jgi:hypothetical protein